MSDSEPIDFVTGFPDVAIARQLVLALLDEPTSLHVRCVVSRTQRRRAEDFARRLSDSKQRRLSFLEGEAFGLDFGLSGAEWKDTAARVRRIHHASQITTAGLDRAEAFRVNRASTVEAIELARHAPNLERVILWSSASVSGKRHGFVLEDELDIEHESRNPVEESLRRSELLLRASKDELPITILRPGLMVGDSRTGEIDRREGVYLLILMMLSAPSERPMPMPSGVDSPLSLVPIDYVVRAGLRISNDSRSLGRTFHLVDPDPLTAGRVFELLARSVGRSLPKSFLPPFLATRLMRLPGIQPGGAEPLPRAFLDQLSTDTIYDDHGTRQLLAGTGIVCPAFESYVNALVRYVREEQLGAPPPIVDARSHRV